MADIIPFETRQQLEEEKKAELGEKNKFIIAHKTLHCARCASRCEKCGSQVDMHEGHRDVRVPYRFCDTCSAEYIDYIERLQGRGNAECYWHNDTWLDMWHKWIEYQGAVNSYIQSKDFLRLVQELQNDGHDL